VTAFGFDVHDHEPGASGLGEHADAAAVARLWAGVRLAVVDTETVVHDGEIRVVSLAVVTCRAGLVRGKWQTLVNADVPVDPDSARIHGLTDEHLAGEPSFAEIADTLQALLTAPEGETLVFVAHYANFDAGVLRSEFERIGEQIPDLPILDTAGRLPALVGIRSGTSLADLAQALGVAQARPHDALDDAYVCAEAATALLNRAATAGEADFAALLTEAGSDHTTRTIPAVDARSLRRRARRSKPLPSDHIEGHSTLLSARAGHRMLADWQDQVRDCAKLRCRHLDDRVANAGPAPATLIPLLETVLDECVTAGDVPGAATALGALLPLLPSRPPRTGRLGFRNSQLAWTKTWAPRLEPLRCGSRDRCPACRRHEPCPLDTWPDTVAAAALGDPERYARGFFETTGKEAGTGAYTNWCDKGAQVIADTAVALCIDHWRRIGQATRAEQVAQLAWNAGCRHPDIVDAYAGQIAAAGSVTDLRTALAACKFALRTRQGSTHDGWARLQARSHQLAGQLERQRIRPSGRVDPDGNPIPLRRHHPTAPRRFRPPRFRRNGSASAHDGR